MINANDILQTQLARSLGLDRYTEIMNGDPSSPTFQRLFNGYYRIRRNEEWRKYYYDLFVKAKAKHYDFAKIITSMFNKFGSVEASFSSKMLATINPDKPIWDQYVSLNLGFELAGRTQDEKLNNAISLYDRMEQWYKEYLASDEGERNIQIFDRMLPTFTWLSQTKKIDCLLWSKR